jgi:hypothetical protein
MFPGEHQEHRVLVSMRVLGLARHVRGRWPARHPFRRPVRWRQAPRNLLGTVRFLNPGHLGFHSPSGTAGLAAFRGQGVRDHIRSPWAAGRTRRPVSL